MLSDKELAMEALEYNPRPQRQLGETHILLAYSCDVRELVAATVQKRSDSLVSSASHKSLETVLLGIMSGASSGLLWADRRCWAKVVTTMSGKAAITWALLLAPHETAKRAARPRIVWAEQSHTR